MQLSVLEYAESTFGERATVMPRSWLSTHLIGERAYMTCGAEMPKRAATPFSDGVVPEKLKLDGVWRPIGGDRADF